MNYLIFISVAVGGVLLYLLSSSSANTEVFSVNYYGLLGLTGLLALSLMGLVGYQLWRLRIKLKNRVFGAKLTLRLVVFFTLIAVLPGILIYAVSVQFLDKSIESWFDVRVEKALEGGLNLGRSGLDNSLNELAKKANLPHCCWRKNPLANISPRWTSWWMKKWRRKRRCSPSTGSWSRPRRTAGRNCRKLPDEDLMRLALDKGEYAVIDTLPDKGLTLRALVTVNSNRQAGARYVLQFIQPVPKQIEADAETVQTVYRDYQELTLSRLGLKTAVCDHLDAVIAGRAADGGIGGVFSQRKTGFVAGGAGRGNACGGTGRFYRTVSDTQQRRTGCTDRLVQPDDAPVVRGEDRSANSSSARWKAPRCIWKAY